MISMPVLNDAANIVISAPIVFFTTTSSVLVNVTNLFVTIRVSGKRPVLIGIISEGGVGNLCRTDYGMSSGANNIISSHLAFIRDASVVVGEYADAGELDNSAAIDVHAGHHYVIDTGLAKGSYVYRCAVSVIGTNGFTNIQNSMLYAMEI